MTAGKLKKERVVPVETATKIMQRVRECCNDKVQLTVYMENGDPGMLKALGDFTLVDSGNPFADLKDMADNNVLIVAEGSYSILAHQLSTGGGDRGPHADCSLWHLCWDLGVMRDQQGLHL